MITESKFLQLESLQELIKVILIGIITVELSSHKGLNVIIDKWQTKRTLLSSTAAGFDLSDSRWRDLWWRRRFLLPGDVAPCCSREPVGRKINLHVLQYFYQVPLVCVCVCMQGPRVVRVADRAWLPIPAVRARQWELLPGGAGGGGTPATGHTSTAERRHQLSGTGHTCTVGAHKSFRLHCLVQKPLWFFQAAKCFHGNSRDPNHMLKMYSEQTGSTLHFIPACCWMSFFLMCSCVQIRFDLVNQHSMAHPVEWQGITLQSNRLGIICQLQAIPLHAIN